MLDQKDLVPARPNNFGSSRRETKNDVRKYPQIFTFGLYAVSDEKSFSSLPLTWAAYPDVGDTQNVNPYRNTHNEHIK